MTGGGYTLEQYLKLHGLKPETRRQEEARLAREAIERNARDAEALERPNRRKTCHSA